MKHLLHLVPALLFGLAACQGNTTTPAEAPAAAPAPPAPVAAAPVPTAPADPEHLDVRMLSVIGLPDKQLTTSQLTRQLGRPDSIAKGAAECGSRLNGLKIDSPDGDFWYYGKTMYEVNGTQAILCTFNVTSGKFQGKIGKLVLNQNTTLEDVRRFFPKAAKAADKPSTGRAGEEMYLPFYYKDEAMDESLNLLFKNGHLQEVEFFSPC